MSQFAAAVNYSMLALAYNVPLLFASQLPTVFMHTMHAAQAAITQLSSDDDRATDIGKLSLSYATGMVVGSFLGGNLGMVYGYGMVAYLAAAVSFLAIPMNYKYLPNLVAPKASAGKGLDISKISKLMGKPAVRDMVILQLIVGLGLSVHSKSFSQVLRVHFELDASTIGQVMSVGGVVSVLTNVVVIPYMSGLILEMHALRGAIEVLGMCFLLYAMTYSLPLLFVGSVPLTICSTVIYTLFSTAMSKAVEKSEAGTSIGLGHACRTLCGIASPLIAAYLYEMIGFAAIGGFGLLSCVLAIMYALRSGAFHHEVQPTTSSKKDK